MKKSLFVLLAAGVFACQSTPDQTEGEKQAALIPDANWEYYGDSISAEDAVDVTMLPALIEGKDSLQLKLQAEVSSSCVMKGCWMKVKLADGEEMRVSFKDYGFFVPKDLQGGKAVIQGTISRTITDVETLRHYAQDEGATEEEIEKITEPEEAYTFVADGVLLSEVVLAEEK